MKQQRSDKKAKITKSPCGKTVYNILSHNLFIAILLIIIATILIQFLF